ncbi:MAG: glycoside hydrolase family 130 protein [Candidatus Dormibacteria bacterium]
MARLRAQSSVTTGAGGQPFALRRLGVLAEPDPDRPEEIEGILNPGVTRDQAGLGPMCYPRLVARGNFSRIGMSRVRMENGEPAALDRLGIALEPEEPYELRPDGGGCEDPRVTWVEPVSSYLMTYTAVGPSGPRVALAASSDLVHWNRLGRVRFVTDTDEDHVFHSVDNKDALMFPVAVPGPHGEPSLAIIHRPLFPGTEPHELAHQGSERVVNLQLESMWISYHHLERSLDDPSRVVEFHHHHRLASPVNDWESLKIGGGAPPVLTRLGWLVIYHGVCEEPSSDDQKHVRYSAGAMVLDPADPRRILYRSSSPILTPDAPGEAVGTVHNVVFPTGVDVRTDLGRADRVDVYYGMADYRIGVATMTLPEGLPAGAPADSPEAAPA